ncbi:hypothetical protein [Bosea sp. NBC_00550]|uniref:hypothetical protein n=1 Tax=Bosea sp. NBC_00550 TaxID=2969621 RepID=UPI00222F4C24|nr:hypothetical protein [Bosea sp. NBC_00550]UZF90417.1 hypothetical protein NWE53_14795 [Bosea sp. NBC_00550]
MMRLSQRIAKLETRVSGGVRYDISAHPLSDAERDGVEAGADIAFDETDGQSPMTEAEWQAAFCREREAR